MKPTVRKGLLPTYAGFAPLLVASAVSLAITIAVWPALARPEIYPDVIVGEIAWQNLDKARDFRALYLFLAITAIVAIALGWYRGNRKDRVVEENNIDSAFAAVFGATTLPFLWWLAVVMSGPPNGKYILPWTKPEIAVRGIFLVVSSALVLRGNLVSRVREKISLPSEILWLSVATVVGMFGMLGIATAIGRYSPSIGVSLSKSGLIFAVAGGLIGFLTMRAALKPSVPSVSPPRVTRQLALLGLQTPLPLLFFVLVPTPILANSGVIPGEFKTALPGFIATLVVLSWLALWHRYRPSRTNSERLEPWLSPLCLAAVAVFVALPSLSTPELAIHPDHLHFGERALPWQQLFAWGKVPYVDFVPIHGLMALSRGFFNHVFFDDAAPGFESANLFLAASFVVSLFLTTRGLVGSAWAFVIAAFSLSPMMSDRFFFFAPAVFVLVQPKLLSRSVAWLGVWLIVCALMVLYNAPIGTALTLGTAPAAVVMAIRLARDRPRRLMVLACIVVTATTALLLTPIVRQMAAGFIQYVRENQEINNVANGIAFEQSFHSSISAADFVLQCFWGLSRLAWVIVLLIAIQIVWRELARPAESRRSSMIWLVALLVPTLIVLSQWTIGRIDTVGGSRTDSLSYVCLFQILPVLLILRWRRAGGFHLSRFSLAFTIPLVLSLADFHTVARALLGHNALQPRILNSMQKIVKGSDLGLPNIGTVIPNQTVRDALDLRASLNEFLRPGETYVNLSIGSDFYYFLNRPAPTVYAETMVPASGAMQARMLAQLAPRQPPVVLLAPWRVVSLRDYYLYRFFLLRYPVVRRGEFVMLVDSSRVGSEGILDRSTQIDLLDSLYRVDSLGGIPSAWGQSWATLARRFTKRLDLVRGASPALHGLRAGSNGLLVVDGPLPFLEYDLSRETISGAAADFVKLDLHAPRGTDVFVSWSVDAHPMTRVVRITPIGDSHTLLIPLGASPSWLLARHVEKLRFLIAGEGAKAGARVVLTNVALMHLNPPR